MKTRIISGIILGAAVAGILVLGMSVNHVIITVFVAILAACASYELLHKALGINCKTAYIGSMTASVLFVALRDDFIRNILQSFLLKKNAGYGKTPDYAQLKAYELSDFILLLAFFFFAAAVILIKHNDFDLGKIFAFTVSPVLFGYGFSSMANLIISSNIFFNGKTGTVKDGIYYLLLLFTFACICDTGAYFTGVTIGKHKLCPEISPKKTVEGALGGIVSSMIAVIIITLCFGNTEKMLTTVIFTIPLCILGMMGDLFASIIKRKVGIKDYSNLIPGHGGILDRFDSMLFIAPALYILAVCGVL